MTHLFSFVGNSDLAASGVGHSCRADEPGPIVRVLDSGLSPWWRVTLIDDRADSVILTRYREWLCRRFPARSIDIHRHPVSNPAAFEEVMAAALSALQNSSGRQYQRVFLTTPGTSAMGMAWMFLALQPNSCARLVTAHTNQACRWVELPSTMMGVE